MTKNEIIDSIKNKSLYFRNLDDNYKNDRDIVLEVVKKNGYALDFASNELKNAKDIVLAAIKKNGNALKYASEQLQDNKEIVLIAVKKNGYALQYASERLKNDKDIIIETLNKLNITSPNLNLFSFKQTINYLEKNLIFAIKKNGILLSIAPLKIKNNKEIVLAAVKQNSDAFYHASKEIKNEIGNNDPIEYLELAILKEKKQQLKNKLTDTLTITSKNTIKKIKI